MKHQIPKMGMWYVLPVDNKRQAKGSLSENALLPVAWSTSQLTIPPTCDNKGSQKLHPFGCIPPKTVGLAVSEIPEHVPLLREDTTENDSFTVFLCKNQDSPIRPSCMPHGLTDCSVRSDDSKELVKAVSCFSHGVIILVTPFFDDVGIKRVLHPEPVPRFRVSVIRTTAAELRKLTR